MISRVAMRIPSKYWCKFWKGDIDVEPNNRLYVNRDRVALVMILKAAFPTGGAKVAVMAYNCPTVSQAVVYANCQIVYVDVDDHLHLDINSLQKEHVDAVIVSHLFGIKNDIAPIRKLFPNALIIDDCAHGYGLENLDGDYAVYSICRGKFPYCGEGGILDINPAYAEKNKSISANIMEQYSHLTKPTKKQECKLFISILIRNFMFHPFIYGLTAKIKFIKWKIKVTIKHIDMDPTLSPDMVIPSAERIIMLRMGEGTHRIWSAMKSLIPQMISMQQDNYSTLKDNLKSHPLVKDVFAGDNAFMCIVRTTNPKAFEKWLATKGIESSTHFKPCIAQNRYFGYINGSCPTAEQLTRELVFIPTYADKKYYEF